VIDTVGAGDCFVGALACALAAGKDLLTAAKIANEMSAIAVTRKGAQQSFPNRNETEALEILHKYGIK